MKMALKNQLSRLGLLPLMDGLRRLPETKRWLESGCSGIAPSPIKRKIIAAYLYKFRLKQFIETGTYLGDTLAYIAHDKSIQCSSIELAESYYQQAKVRFSAYSNVHLLCGDSGAILPNIVRKLESPALFWLDGHYSGGSTGQGQLDTPISAELQGILTSPIQNHVILIDDVRFFDGTNGYPHLDDLLENVRENSDYSVEVSADIVRLTPKPVKL